MKKSGIIIGKMENGAKGANGLKKHIVNIA